MLKNRFFTAFAIAGLIGFTAACAAEEEDVQFEDPTLEETTPAPSIPPAPVTEDTMTAPGATDTTGMGADMGTDTATADSVEM